MDLWDITKLLARRWMIFVPLLVVCGAVAALATARVNPSYVATSYVQLVPPTIGQVQPGQANAFDRNPWAGLGLQALGNASIVTVTDASVAKELYDNGYSDSYTVLLSPSSPLITFEVVGDSAAQANGTTEQLITRFSRTVSTLQTAYGVKQADMITSYRLDVGTNVKESSSTIKRAAVVFAGVGFLLSIGLTIAIDALLRRRQRRRASAAVVPAITPVIVPQWDIEPGAGQPSDDASAKASGPDDGEDDASRWDDEPQELPKTGSGQAPDVERDADATIVLPGLSDRVRG
ncbi:YveK family protein [Catellatospora paridis]|uniref:hypothetical protein n=1 Tax=Catellatospora paridis TaxID=1617086 RepID=UPI0012D42B40|nr:hypothetical protein [Catellatospora paridis]